MILRPISSITALSIRLWEAPKTSRQLWRILSWINKTKDQEEEVIHPVLSINQFFDFQEENNEDLLDYFIAEPDISK